MSPYTYKIIIGGIIRMPYLVRDLLKITDKDEWVSINALDNEELYFGEFSKVSEELLNRVIFIVRANNDETINIVVK